jgi:hypothetical protein
LRAGNTMVSAEATFMTRAGDHVYVRGMLSPRIQDGRLTTAFGVFNEHVVGAPLRSTLGVDPNLLDAMLDASPGRHLPVRRQRDHRRLQPPLSGSLGDRRVRRKRRQRPRRDAPPAGRPRCISGNGQPALCPAAAHPAAASSAFSAGACSIGTRPAHTIPMAHTAAASGTTGMSPTACRPRTCTGGWPATSPMGRC